MGTSLPAVSAERQLTDGDGSPSATATPMDDNSQSVSETMLSSADMNIGFKNQEKPGRLAEFIT